jgi:hypothetical protein
VFLDNVDLFYPIYSQKGTALNMEALNCIEDVEGLKKEAGF